MKYKMEDIVFRRYSKIAHLLTFTLSLTSSKLIKKILSFLVEQERHSFLFGEKEGRKDRGGGWLIGARTSPDRKQALTRRHGVCFVAAACCMLACTDVTSTTGRCTPVVGPTGALMVVGGEKGNVTLRRACLTKAWLPCPHPTINNQLWR